MALSRSGRAFCAALCCAAAFAQNPPRVPTGADVMVRGSSDLPVALGLAVAPAFAASAKPQPVVFVVDVTPYLRENEPALDAAFADLKAKFGAAGDFRLARLGEAPGPSRADPTALVGDLGRAFHGDDLVFADTVGGLTKSLAGLPGPAIAVYLADWNVEDERDLEPLVADLKKRGVRFFAIGSEGGFGRPWIDGFFPPDRGARQPDGTSKLYDTDVGRAPFGPFRPEARVRSGDTAWTHLPFHWHGAWWSTTFGVDLRTLAPRKRDSYGRSDKRGGKTGVAEDVRERKGDVDETAMERYAFPLPSSFGPYPLMRLCAETGGRYVLWSWNRTGRTTLVYDDSRCDAFAPDLRSREAIRLDVARRALPRAIVDAWQQIANRDVMVARTTSGVGMGGRPFESVEPESEGFIAFGWPEPADRTGMIANARATLPALDSAIRTLTTALGSEKPRDAVDRRYAADADLLRHTLLVHRFTIGEALQCAEREVPADAFADKRVLAGLDPVIAIHGGHRPETAVIVESAPIRDRKLCERVRDDRARMLERYAGTPFGELVGRNRVHTVEFRKSPYGSGAPGKQSPANSDARRGRTGPGSAPGQGGTTGG